MKKIFDEYITEATINDALTKSVHSAGDKNKRRKIGKAINESIPGYNSDDDEDDTDPKDKKWYAKYDGWSKTNNAVEGVSYICEQFSDLDYELKNCKRGSRVVTGGTAKDLLAHCKGLMNEFEDVLDELEKEIKEKGGE